MPGGAALGPFKDVLKDPIVATVNATEKGVRYSTDGAVPIETNAAGAE